MPTTHEQFMKIAIQLARENVRSGRGGPFGCVVVRDGTIIAKGVNLVTSNADPTAHAEIVAIRRACEVLGSYQLTDCDVYTSCEPCPMCLGALYWARPERVFFSAGHADASAAGFDDTFIFEEFGRQYEGRKLPMSRILPTEGEAPFEDWVKLGGKKY